MNQWQESLFELIDQRGDAIADLWYRAIAHTSFVPHPASEIRSVLLDLTRLAITLVASPELDREAAQAIGAALPRLNYTAPESLSRTLEILSIQITHDLPPEALIQIQPPLAALLGSIAAGFFRQVRSTILDDQEEIRYALLLERRRAEHALAQARDQALETARLKTGFLATMSHELRTPLNAIIGFTDLTLDQQLGTLNEQQRSNLERVRRNARTLLNLINSVLDMSKIDAGSMQLADESVRVAAVVESAVANIEALVLGKQLALRIVWPDGTLPLIRGDATRLQQVIVNLLSNAVKFTPAHGSILVLLEHGLPSALHSAALPDGNLGPGPWLVISVQDSGVGIAPEELARIWNEFYQVDSSSTRQYSGTGLGLAIAKRLIMLMRGAVGVRSVLGGGSTFSIWLPIEREVQQTDTEPRSQF